MHPAGPDDEALLVFCSVAQLHAPKSVYANEVQVTGNGFIIVDVSGFMLGVSMLTAIKLVVEVLPYFKSSPLVISIFIDDPSLMTATVKTKDNPITPDMIFFVFVDIYFLLCTL